MQRDTGEAAITQNTPGAGGGGRRKAGDRRTRWLYEATRAVLTPATSCQRQDRATLAPPTLWTSTMEGRVGITSSGFSGRELRLLASPRRVQPAWSLLVCLTLSSHGGTHSLGHPRQQQTHDSSMTPDLPSLLNSGLLAINGKMFLLQQPSDTRLFIL